MEWLGCWSASELLLQSCSHGHLVRPLLVARLQPFTIYQGIMFQHLNNVNKSPNVYGRSFKELPQPHPLQCLSVLCRRL
jgi:hypothetical protein